MHIGNLEHYSLKKADNMASNNDITGLTEGYQSALDREQNQRDFDYQKERDEIDKARYGSEFAYKKARDEVADYKWQKELDLKKLQYENALKKAKSSRSGGGSKKVVSAVDDDSFFKMKGTAATKTYSGNTVDTSRNATLSVNVTHKYLNQMLNTKSESEAAKLLNQLAYDGQISKGDYNYLVDLYNGAKERGIKEFTLDSRANSTISSRNNVDEIAKEAAANKVDTGNDDKSDDDENLFTKIANKLRKKRG